MLSRVADSIYWMNRYVERAENVARFVDVNLNLLLDSPPGMQQQWAPLVVTTGDQDIFKERYGEATAENVLRFLTFDKEYPNSIISCLRTAREKCPFRQGGHFLRDVGAGQRLLPDGERSCRYRLNFEPAHLFPRSKNVQPFVCRGDGSHHGPYRRMALWPAGGDCWNGPTKPPAFWM